MMTPDERMSLAKSLFVNMINGGTVRLKDANACASMIYKAVENAERDAEARAYEACAKIAEKRYQAIGWDTGYKNASICIAAAIRSASPANQPPAKGTP